MNIAAASRFVDVPEEEINLMKENDIPRNTKHATKFGMTLRLVNIGEYSPRLRLGEYSPIITSPSANNCKIYVASQVGRKSEVKKCR